MENSWLVKFLSGKMGWKTVTSGVLIMVAGLGEALGWGGFSTNWDLIVKIAVGLGIVGGADKIAKLQDALKK